MPEASSTMTNNNGPMIAAVIAAIATAGEIQTVTPDVPGMTCKFCPITVRKALSRVPGVIEAKSDYASKTATVTFDPDKASLSDLTRATANTGYPSTAGTQ